MRTGAKIIARSALEVLLDEKLRERMWEDYSKEMERGREH
jgi:hypothetical protein